MTLIALLPLLLSLIFASAVVAQSGTDNFTVPIEDNVTQYPWYNPTVSPVNEGSKSSSVLVLVSIFAILFVLCSLIICVAVRCYRRRSKSSWKARQENHGYAKKDTDVELDECFSHRPRRFTYDELRAATRNFSEDKKLGQGGFGAVYRGKLLDQNREEVVAVKRISPGSNQGKKEYIAEVTTISKLRHRNLVQLWGWCHQKGEFLLVYEFLPNGSLDKYLFENKKAVLSWKQRYSVACDIAAALVYLHEECEQRVLHRDVKSSNVMLDSQFNAKLGDFGLARLVERDQAPSHTTAPAGTFGYLAPECVNIGKASVESDVFSFGAVSLEIACGRHILDTKSGKRLVERVWDLYGRGKLLDCADKELNGNFKNDELQRLLLLGLLCSHPDPRARPKMRKALKILNVEARLPNVPLKMPTGYGASLTST